MPVPLPDLQIKAILTILHAHGTTLLEFITSVIMKPATQQMLSYVTRKLSSRPSEAIQYPDRQHSSGQKGVTIEICRRQVLELTRKENGLHFTARNTTEKRIQEF